MKKNIFLLTIFIVTLYGSSKSSFDVTTINNLPSLTLQLNSFFGSSIENIGDMDNDGVSDIVVGSEGFEGVGSAFVLYMKPDNTVKSYSKIQPVLEIDDYFGSSIAFGDINNDGNDEIIIGSRGDDYSEKVNSGSIYIYDLNFTLLKKISPLETISFDNFGKSLCFIGNFNNNRINYLAVGANGANNFGGEVNILSFDNEFNYSIVKTISNNTSFESSGYSLSFEFPNKLYVGYSGKDLFKGKVNKIEFDNTFNISVSEFITGSNVTNGEMFGSSLCFYDFDGNDTLDVAIGLQAADTGKGKVQVLFNGSTEKNFTISSADQGLSFLGANSQLGSSVSALTNDNGYFLITSTPNQALNQKNTGAVNFIKITEVATLEASSIGDNSAILNGDYSSFGSSGKVYFEYGTTLSYGDSTTILNVNPRLNSKFSYNLSELTSETTYYFRSVNKGANGKIYGESKSFKTKSIPVIVEGEKINLETNEDSDKNFSLNATYEDGVNLLVWEISDNSVNGTVNFVSKSNSSMKNGKGASSSFIYEPRDNFFGVDSCKIRVYYEDLEDVITVYLNILPINDPPKNHTKPSVNNIESIRIGGKLYGNVGVWNDNDDNPDEK
ncbi:MAG: VCBS repeat-containing protein [Candidatus Delongbacteria bacterium]|nr:VCBS repeat-containing protein [Candidatus Delongbacteria bacterium]MBN2836306.1 VCBS repeat-containing protein [Candidatus Delongbacteria bacterium]